MKATPTQLAIVVLIGLLPLIKFSLEDPYLPRATKIFIAASIIILCKFFYTHHFSVQKIHRPVILLLLVFGISSFVIGIYPANPNAIAFFIFALLFGSAVWLMRTHIHRLIMIATLVGCIGIYAQWGIAQFIVQHDIGMYVVGESRVQAGDAGVATFSDGPSKYIRAYGPFGHPNSFAGSIIIGAIFIYTLKPISRIYTSSIFLVYTLGLITSFSRASLAAYILILLMVLIKKRQQWLFVCTILPLLVCTPLMLQRSFDQNSVALEDRLHGLSWLKDMTTFETLVRGYGIGNYKTALVSYLTNHHIPYSSWDVAPIHSVPLLIFAEFGLILGVVLFILGTLFFVSYQSFIVITLLPVLILDHYFISQIGPLVLLITCTLLVVHYRGEHRTY